MDPCFAAIDGPGLAYHVLRLCSRKTLRPSPFEQPSYQLLGRTAIEWLDQLESHGISVYASSSTSSILSCMLTVMLCQLCHLL